MEANTILLDVEKYNELRDFKLNIEKGNTLHVYSGGSYFGNYETFITENEAVKKLVENVKELNSIISDLKNPKKEDISIYTIQKMSIWEFMKWRKSHS